MKRLSYGLIAIAWLAGAHTAMAGGPPAPLAARDLSAQSAAMKKLSFLEGNWTGEKRTTQRDGSLVLSRSEDSIEALQNGAVLTFRGRGYALDAPAGAAPAAETLGIMNYDERTNQYEIRTYALGYVNIGKVQSVEDGAMRWSLDTPGGRVQFFLLANGPNGWIERVEQSTDDGLSWSTIFETRFVRRTANAPARP